MCFHLGAIKNSNTMNTLPDIFIAPDRLLAGNLATITLTNPITHKSHRWATLKDLISPPTTRPVQGTLGREPIKGASPPLKGNI